jgi:predicted nucleotidyltransferase
MTVDEIREKLNSDEYGFLRSSELEDRIILLTTGGSHAYGTDVPGSDLDIRGVMLNTYEEILTMEYRNKPYEDSGTDTVIYPLQQLKRLLINANPNIIEMLGTREDHLFMITPEGRLLRCYRNLFLSKRVGYSFGGYAISQMRRLQNALARDEYPQADKEMHIMNSILNAMTTFEDKYRGYVNGSIRLYIADSEKPEYEKEIFMDASFSGIPLRDFKSMYSEMNNIIRDYDRLNHRNRKKDDIHVNKHAMHLVRLLVMGSEILEGKGINTYREHDRDFLLKIRNGDYVAEKDGKPDYSAVFEIVDECEKRFNYAMENTDLPGKPDEKAINELVMEINSRILARARR